MGDFIDPGLVTMGERRGELRLRVLSLGAGVQSTAMFLMACAGEIDRPDYAIFADTQWEGPWTYECLVRLLPHAERAGIPIHIVSFGDLRKDTLAPVEGKRAATPPVFVKTEGKRGITPRQCTTSYKIEPIKREVRRLLGVPKGGRVSGHVETWHGISLDEAHRMKPAPDRWVVTRYPLIEKRMRRQDCVRWLERYGFEPPWKSACIGCPYHDNAFWRELQSRYPAQWEDAVDFDRRVRHGIRGLRNEAYLHSSLLPLDQAPIHGAVGQGELFGQECAGVCGV